MSDRQQYIDDTKSGKNPGACMMVPTLAFGRNNIGIGHFGFDFNHCNMHLADLAGYVKNGFDSNSGFKGNVFSLPGVSDGISMGYDAMRHSLVSRDINALSIVNHFLSAPYEGAVLIPGCDKNMPSAAMALLHLDIPSYILCGGSIHPGHLDGKDIDIVDSFIASGQLEKKLITEEQRMRVLMNACPGPGACGGMYTANSMFTIFEAMGLTPLYSSSRMAVDKESECREAYKVFENLNKLGLTPRKIVSKESFENAVRIVSVLGGSTNPILHLLAMARVGGISFDENDFEDISRKTPFLGNLMPSGQFRMKDLSKVGGTPAILRYMLESGHLDGNVRTITGRTLGEDLEHIDYDRDKLLGSGVIASFNKPKLERGHLVKLSGNLGKGWTKISGSGDASYEGRAVVFNSQREFLDTWNEKINGEGDFGVIRYEGPRGSPGCPEMLAPTTLLIGKFGKEAKIGLMTDGRFSGGSVGGAPIIGHVDEAYDGHAIALIRDGDRIFIDPKENRMDLCISDDEMLQRKDNFKLPSEVEKKVMEAPLDLYAYHKQTNSVRHGASMVTRYVH